MATTTPKRFGSSHVDAITGGLVGGFAALLLMIWVGYCSVSMAVNNPYIGNGSSMNGPFGETNVLWVPILYLLIVLVSSLPFVRGRGLGFMAILGHGVLVPAILLVAGTQGFEPFTIRITISALVVLDLAWLALLGLRLRLHSP